MRTTPSALAVAVVIFYGLVAVSGALGVVGPGPSASVSALLGVPQARWLFSAQVAAFALLGLLSRLRGWRGSEMVALVGVAFGFAVNGVAVILTGPAGWASGLRVVAVTIVLVAYGYTRGSGADDIAQAMLRERRGSDRGLGG